MFEKALQFVKANRDAIIKKGLVVLGVTVATAVVAALVPNRDPELMAEETDVVDTETGEVETVVTE